MAPGKCGSNLKSIPSERMLRITFMSTSCAATDIAVIKIPHNVESTLVKVMAWWLDVTNNYLGQCLLRYLAIWCYQATTSSFCGCFYFRFCPKYLINYCHHVGLAMLASIKVISYFSRHSGNIHVTCFHSYPAGNLLKLLMLTFKFWMRMFTGCKPGHRFVCRWSRIKGF